MRLNRREWLGLSASVPLALMPARLAAARTYRVGVGRSPYPYVATRRALQASGEWPSVAGRVVVIKPNLVSPAAASTGVATDPDVVRALVDQALADSALEVLIVEAGPQGANFTECGYDFFASYDSLARVRLVDMTYEPFSLVPVPNGLVYSAIYTPDVLVRPDTVFISAAKLKTHGDAVASLAMKNLFGNPVVDRYLSWLPVGRFSMHDRGVHQTVVDLNLLRPVDFAVVDGVWAMEGNGPLAGTPVRMNTVLAGRNALAVDRIAAMVMEIPGAAIRHLDYSTRHGLGPARVDEVVAAGDPLATRPFVLPALPPVLEYPRVLPSAFDPVAGQRTAVLGWYAQAYWRQVEIVRLFDELPHTEILRTLKPLGLHPGGYEVIPWDGRGDDGSLVAPGRYGVHVRAGHVDGRGRAADATGWVSVVRN